MKEYNKSNADNLAIACNKLAKAAEKVGMSMKQFIAACAKKDSKPR